MLTTFGNFFFVIFDLILVSFTNTITDVLVGRSVGFISLPVFVCLWLGILLNYRFFMTHSHTYVPHWLKYVWMFATGFPYGKFNFFCCTKTISQIHTTISWRDEDRGRRKANCDYCERLRLGRLNSDDGVLMLNEPRGYLRLLAGWLTCGLDCCLLFLLLLFLIKSNDGRTTQNIHQNSKLSTTQRRNGQLEFSSKTNWNVSVCFCSLMERCFSLSPLSFSWEI